MTTALLLPALPNPLQDGWTLPASWYTDLAVQERERERLFARAWTYAGPAEWVSEPGSYFSAHVGHVPVAVVRGTDGTLRGLVNVCRHRGHLVVDVPPCRERPAVGERMLERGDLVAGSLGLDLRHACS